MDFADLMRQRYSVRQYQNKKVEDEKLTAILEAARIAPTGGNRQPFKLIVAQSAEAMEKVAKAGNMHGAPLAVIVCGEKEKAWVRSCDQKNIVDIDASIVTAQMMLQATDLGIGSVWICNFNPEIIRKEFNLDDGLEAINILLLGYASGEPASAERFDKQRKPLQDLVIYK